MMLDLTILIPTKNEEKNLLYCLEPILGWAKEIVIVDSNSNDQTIKIANDNNVKVINFDYKGGWPKKRQYVLDNYSFITKWVLLLDVDEILSEQVKFAIQNSIQSDLFDGYYLWFRLEFLGRMLLMSDPGLRKLSLFKVGMGNFEKRFLQQDNSMGDMEVHEHVVVVGRVGEIKTPILHRNFNSLSRFIMKHDEYSNYEAKVHTEGTDGDLKAKFWGTKEQRRRWIKSKLIRCPISPLAYFFYLYFLKGGFLEGKAGFYYILYQCIYLYFVQSKIYEIEKV